MIMQTNLIKLSRAKKIHPSRKMIIRRKKEFRLMEMGIMRAKMTDIFITYFFIFYYIYMYIYMALARMKK